MWWKRGRRPLCRRLFEAFLKVVKVRVIPTFFKVIEIVPKFILVLFCHWLFM